MKPRLLDLNKIRDKKVLAIGAHSDDLEFGAGGTLLQLSAHNQIQVVQATDSRLGTHDPKQDIQALITTRMEEARRAASMYRADVSFWSYPDMQLKNNVKKLERRLVKLLLKVQPDIVITFDPWARYEVAVHPDHRTISMIVVEAVMKATLPQLTQKMGLGYRYLSPKSSVWLMVPAQANVVVSVAPVWKERIELLKVFESQFDEDVVWDKVERMIVTSAKDAGEPVDIEKGEAFRILEYDGVWDSAD